MVRSAIFILAGASWIYWAMACWAVARLLKGKRSGGATSPAAHPPLVSILKPVKGVDAEAYENFVSFCQQDYPAYEILFGVADENDPAVAVIDRLQREFPRLDIRLIVGSASGANPKAGLLHRLCQHARGEVLAISDSDIRVPRDYLQRILAPLADGGVGIVTCGYRGEKVGNWVARLTALHMGTAFLPSVALAHGLFGQRLGLGATLAVRRRDLERIGGFAAFADYLADDYQLAARIAALGLRIHLSDFVVGHVLGQERFIDEWQREVRWARTVRACSPAGYAGMPLTFSTPLALAAAAVPGWWPGAGLMLAGALGVRWLASWFILRRIGQRADLCDMLLLPLRDLLSAIVWMVGLVGWRITWRGRDYALDPDGRLHEIHLLPMDPLSRLVRWIDATLRRRQGMFEYSRHPECMLRISIARAEEDAQLADGTRIARGESIGELHLWNERVPRIGADGPGMRWGLAMYKQFGRSMEDLALAAQRDERLRTIKAFHGRSIFDPRQGDRQLARMGAHFGLEMLPPRRLGLGRRIHDFFENFLLLGLAWAFNRQALRNRRFLRTRREFWISRTGLVGQRNAAALSPVSQTPSVEV